MSNKYAPRQKYNYYFDICQRGYKNKKKSTSYAAGFCDGYDAEFPYVNFNDLFRSGKDKKLYSRGYYKGLTARYPHYKGGKR